MAAAGIDTMLARAVACLNARDWAGGEAHAEAALAQAPGHPVALYLWGLALFEQGRPLDAAVALAKAWAVAPEQLDIAVALARAQRGSGQAARAVALLTPLAGKAPADPELLVELALAHEESGAPAIALDMLVGILAQWPGIAVAAARAGALATRLGQATQAIGLLRSALATAEADAVERSALHYQLGTALKATRRFDEALTELDHALAAAPDRAVVQKARASVLQHLRRHEDAMIALREVLALDPLDMGTHVQLSELIHRQDLPGATFLRSYDEAAMAAPGSLLPHLAKGHALLTVGRPADAYDAYAAALHIARDHPAALAGAGRALEALGEIDQARYAHQHSIAGGGEPAALVDAAAFLLRQGEADEALALAARAVARQPEGQGALAMLGLCHRARDDEAEYRLNDYARLVRSFDLEPPRGFADMASFNAELAHYLDALHGDRRENYTQTLRGGTRLYDSIFGNGHKLAELLRERIDEALGRYVAELPADTAHPFIGRRSNSLSYVSSWSSRMDAAGYHLNHIHPEGWLSSAYYVSVPDVVADEERQEGWLTFGQPTPDFGALTPRRTVRPEIGRLVLFPSYIWHGTTRSSPNSAA